MIPVPYFTLSWVLDLACCGNSRNYAKARKAIRFPYPRLRRRVLLIRRYKLTTLLKLYIVQAGL